MAAAFISHASEDKYFVDLLVELLKYHHVDCWYDKENIRYGKRWKEEISAGIENSDYFIVVVSANTLKADYVKLEIKEFQVRKPQNEVIPILLSPIALDEVYDGLKDYQGILFYENMLSGFETLLEFFGREFLPPFERRSKSDRRADERRGERDRRGSSTLQRLRYGLWGNYEAATGKGKFDPLEDSVLIQGEFARALKGKGDEDPKGLEINRYKYFDKETGEEIEISFQTLLQLIYEVFNRLRSMEHVSNVYVTDALAELLINKFDVQQIEKRQGADRRSREDRRGDSEVD